MKIYTPVVAALICCMPLLARSAGAQSAFVAPDKSFSFTAPASWQITQEGDRLRLTAPDRASFSLLPEVLATTPGGDPMVDGRLRSLAESRARLLLTGLRFDSARPVSVRGGAGAVYRYRGKSPVNGRTALVDIWFGVVGAHNVLITPEVALQPDHSIELGAILQTIRFTGRARPVPGKAAAATPGMATQGVSTAPSLREEYAGRLQPKDASFALRLYYGGKAEADWSSLTGQTAKMAGTYTGQDGNYRVNLTQASGANALGAKTLTLHMRALGGNEIGQFTSDVTPARRDIAEIKLMSVAGVTPATSAKTQPDKNAKPADTRTNPNTRPAPRNNPRQRINNPRPSRRGFNSFRTLRPLRFTASRARR